MLKKTITYIDYDNNERTEDFYFNLSEAEIMEMQLSKAGGFDKMLQDILAAQDVPAIAKMYKEIILKAYGKKSPDGKRFIKSDELREEFEQTEAFSQLFMELLTTEDDAAPKFIKGIVPSKYADKLPDQLPNKMNN